MKRINELHRNGQKILIKARGHKGRMEIHEKYQSMGDEYQREKSAFNRLMLEYKKIINEIQILVYEKYV
jgi:hypothetical protein